MALAVAALGGLVVSFHYDSGWVSWVLCAAAVATGLPGLVLAVTRHIMRDVD